ncbi:MAG: 16S rRNA processing protein RimM, partial [Clostridia bacterium]|nr:16S rRNA processing protein RimM [Clostridia bacterium]
MREYIEAGRIINTHGVRGAVKAESWCDSPAVLKKMKRLFFRQAKENVFLET